MIVQGDNGTILRRVVKDDAGVVNLTNATVTALINDGKRSFSKQGVVTENGFDLVLNAEDLIETGYYTIQCTVTFQDGKEFSEKHWLLPVNKRGN